MIYGLGNLPSNVLIDNPAGTWSFFGSVDVRLGKLLNGEVITTEEQAVEAMKWHGVPFQKYTRPRVYQTKEDAEKAAHDLGLVVNYPVKA